jgi:hypothetical protein
MNAVLRIHGPGLDWLPAVLRQRATWRTVWRFVWLGPLVGVLPWAWLVISIPLAYVVGGPAAAVAGLLFASWYHSAGREPSWPWRATVGILAGLGATAAVALFQVLTGLLDESYVALVAVHGVPAAAVMALLQKPTQKMDPRATPQPANEACPPPEHAC